MRKLLVAVCCLPLAVNMNIGAQAQATVGDATERIDAGEQLASIGNWSDAQAEFVRATQLDKDNLLAFYDLGVAQAHLNNFEHTIVAEREALRINKNYVPAYIELGIALLQINDMQGAIEAEQQALELDPENLIAQKNLAAIQQMHPNFSKAFVNVKEAALPPAENVQPPHQNKQHAYAQADLAWSLAKNGQWQKAKAAYEKALKLDSQLVIAKTGVAICTAKMGRYQQAVALLKDTKVQFPDSAWPHLGLAVVFGDHQKIAEAKKELDEALALDPDNVEAQRQQAALLLQQSDWAAAGSAYKILLSKSTASAEDHIGMGLVLSGNDDSKGAIAEFKQAIALEPNNASAHAALGLELASCGQQAEAIDQAMQAMNLDPKQQLAQSLHHKLNNQIK